MSKYFKRKIKYTCPKCNMNTFILVSVKQQIVKTLQCKISKPIPESRKDHANNHALATI